MTTTRDDRSERCERWKGYQCPYCEIERTLALLRRLHSMLAARDPVVFSQELGFIEAELQGRNGSVGVRRVRR